MIPELTKCTLSDIVEEPMEIDMPDPNTSFRYFCPLCNNIVKEVENVVSYNDRSIACDKCNLWFHFKCANVKQNEAMNSKTWYCQKCR